MASWGLALPGTEVLAAAHQLQSQGIRILRHSFHRIEFDSFFILAVEFNYKAGAVSEAFTNICKSIEFNRRGP